MSSTFARRCAAVLVAFSGPVALAQDAVPPDGSTTSGDAATPGESPASDLGGAIDDYLGSHVDEVLVVAERPYGTPLTWAGGRSTIGPDEVRGSGAPTIGELLRRRPSFHIEEESESDSKPNIGLRGLNPSRSTEVALLVDGIPLAPAPYGHPGQSLFPITLERVHAVDILRGGARRRRASCRDPRARCTGSSP